MTDDNFAVIFDRLPTAFVANIDARLDENKTPMSSYDFLARAIPKNVQEQLIDAFDETAEAIAHLCTERFGHTVVDLDDVRGACDTRVDAIYQREEVKVYRTLSSWALYTSLEIGVISDALNKVARDWCKP
jgi:hypothetical protein